jgi:flavin-dependent dehydrogenase
MSSSAPQRFDVCIVGGGPAGSITALQLALLGHRVCLFERSVFPRRQVGELLTRGIWPILDSLN